MTCHDAREQLSLLLDGALPSDERSAVEAHLAGCPECQRELARLRATVGLLGRLAPARAPAGFVDRVMATVYPTPWHRRLRDAVGASLRRHRPLEAIAVVCLAGLAVYVYQRLPEVRQAARYAETRSSPAVSTPAHGPATPAPGAGAAGPTGPARAADDAGGPGASGLSALRQTSKVSREAPASAPRAVAPSRVGEPSVEQEKKERVAVASRTDTSPAPRVAAREKPADRLADARDVASGPGGSGGAAGVGASAGVAPGPAAPAPARPGAAASPAAPSAPAASEAAPAAPVRIAGAAKPDTAEPLPSGPSQPQPTASVEAPATTGALGAPLAPGGRPGVAAKTAPSASGAANAERGESQGPALAARPRGPARLLRSVDASGRLLVSAPEAAEAALDGLLARLGGVRAARRVERPAGPVLIDVLIPASRYPELVAGLARIGRWTPEHEIGSLPAEVRVEVAIFTEP